MQLVKFSATNFRSITTVHSITFSGITILIGKNNEGKSNFLKALEAAMLLLKKHSSFKTSTLLTNTTAPYIWARDFPIQLQGRKGVNQTIFKLQFELTEIECLEFKKAIGPTLNGLLPLEIRIGKDHDPQIRLVKRGKGTKALASKSSAISNFIAERIYFNYIPAIRTESTTINLIRDLLSRELRRLESDPKYIQALQQIADLQRPVLDELEKRVSGPLKEFLPSIKSVHLEISDIGRRYSLRQDISVFVDDGTLTSIEYKGDGVKSLSALGLLKNHNPIAGVSILAIEEPESHLHPGAIHQVNEIIKQIAEQTQVIISTHNPSLINRENIKSNIIVSDGTASPAKSIANIRDVLGVKVSDNLTHANYSLLVEGETDARIMKAVLSFLSEKISKALKNNLLVVFPLGGTGKLSYKLGMLQNSLCATYTLLDGDNAAKVAYTQAEKDNLISSVNSTLITIPGMKESELEDCINTEIYKDILLEKYEIDVSSYQFKGQKKWSDRLGEVCKGQGKILSDDLLRKIKYSIAELVESNPKFALADKSKVLIESLVQSLERLIKV